MLNFKNSKQREKSEIISNTIQAQIDNEETKSLKLKEKKIEMTENGLRCDLETEAFLIFELVKSMNQGKTTYPMRMVDEAYTQLEKMEEKGYDLDKLARQYKREINSEEN